MRIFLNKISQTIFTGAYMKGAEQQHWRLRTSQPLQVTTVGRLITNTEAHNKNEPVNRSNLSPQILPEKGKQEKMTNCAVTF